MGNQTRSVTMEEIAKRLERIEQKLQANDIQPLQFAEAAKYLGLSKSTLYRLTSQSVIPHHKPGGKKIVFLKTDLDSYLLRNRIHSLNELRDGARWERGHSTLPYHKSLLMNNSDLTRTFGEQPQSVIAVALNSCQIWSVLSQVFLSAPLLLQLGEPVRIFCHCHSGIRYWQRYLSNFYCIFTARNELKTKYHSIC